MNLQLILQITFLSAHHMPGKGPRANTGVPYVPALSQCLTNSGSLLPPIVSRRSVLSYSHRHESIGGADAIGTGVNCCLGKL